MTSIYFLLTGFLVGLSFLGGYYLFALPIGIISGILGVMNSRYRSDLTAQTNILNDTATIDLYESYEDNTSFEVEVDDFNIPSISELRSQVYDRVEDDVNDVIKSVIKALKRANPEIYSICVFFPYGSQSLQIRMLHSDSKHIIEHAIINHDQGIVGTILDPKVNRILENNVEPGEELYYYDPIDPISSLACVPIMVKQQRNGAILIDSLRPQAFNKQTISMLEHFADLVGEMCYIASMNFYSVIEKGQYRSLVKHQKLFLSNQSYDEIIENIFKAVRETLPYERMMLVKSDPNNFKSAKIIYCEGIDAEYFNQQDFSLNDEGLISQCFYRKSSLIKDFSDQEYQFRINPEEKKSLEISSLMATPIVLDAEKKLSDYVLVVESRFANRYRANMEQELLEGLVDYISCALQNYKIAEQNNIDHSKDLLTGLLNHRAFQETYKSEKFRAFRMGYSLGVLAIDLDDFKRVNTSYDYENGDKVLKQVAHEISAILNTDMEVVARYGGEEFLALVLDTSDKRLFEISEKIRKTIENKEFNIGRVDPIKLTVSIGYSLLHPGDDDAVNAISKSIAAMSEAKNQGRNRIIGNI